MNRLILIGNGFDLAHGLKTSYHDFILDYFKNCFIAAISNAEIVEYNDIKYKCWYEDELINISIKEMPHFFDIELSSNEVVIKKFKDATSISELEALSNKYNSNITYKGTGFVKLLFNECITKNWVDIEGIYYEELKKCLKQYNKDKDYNGKVSIGNLIHLNNQLDFIKEKLEIYLKSVLSKGDCNIDEYKSIFLSNQISLGYNLRPKNSLILNFNYTSVPNKYVVAHDFEIINIHGKLSTEENPIIFGYGDEVDKNYKEIEDLNENEFFKHIKSFDYFKTNNYSELLKFIKRDDFEVFVLGHSCGLSDRTMLSTIFNHEKCISIKIFDFREDKNDYRNKTYEISRHFTNKASMRKKIVPFPECKPMPQYNKLLY
jgi:hypothetical protein